MQKFMKLAVAEAIHGMRKNKGGPFGAVIVKNGKVIAKGHNMVLVTKDPTAHAEMVAIRRACKKLKRLDLSDCILYSSGEPCPMCLGAVYWSRIPRVFYGCSIKDSAKAGFDDDVIYKDIRKKARRKLKMRQISRAECLIAFKEWMNKKDRRQY